jgi:hypothetical protein
MEENSVRGGKEGRKGIFSFRYASYRSFGEQIGDGT